MKEIKSSEIAIIVPPARSYSQRLPFGVMYISSYLSSKEEDNVILDFKNINTNKAYEKIKNYIINVKPKYIGISCFVSEVEIVRDMCEFIKKSSKDSVVIIGGPHPSINPHYFIDMKFDYLVIGEGEHTFYELIKTLKNKKDISKVNGIAYIKSKKLIFTPPREFIQDLDSLPFPAYDKVDMDFYCRPNAWGNRPIYLSGLNISSARGCPYHCKFCVVNTIWGQKLRVMSAKRVAEHIEYIVKKYKIDSVYFIDESFTILKERVYELFNLLKEKKIKILFGCQTRVNLIDEKLLRFMKKNGCLQVELGIESGTDKMLKVINKQIEVKDIVNAGNIFKKIKLRTFANMMINLPGEELDDVEKSLNLVKKMRFNVVVWNVYIPYPGVEFDKTLDIEDLPKLLKGPSKIGTNEGEFYDLLEKKYKFAKYDKPLSEVVKNLRSNTFYPKDVKFTLSSYYWYSAFLMFSYLFKYQYWLGLLRSKRKMQYLTNLPKILFLYS